MTVWTTATKVIVSAEVTENIAAASKVLHATAAMFTMGLRLQLWRSLQVRIQTLEGCGLKKT